MKGTFSNFHILGELYPHKRIHLIGGLAYLNKAEAVMKITPTGSYKFGELDIPAEDIGDLNITTKWKGISPYLGVSFGRGVPKKRFGINFDIGTYYLSSPKVNFEGTKMLAANDSNSQIMENNMKDYRFMPVLQLNFNFKL
jgi:hypothetical protein